MEDLSKNGLPDSIIKIDEKLVTNHLNQIVLETVEQTLNGLLEAEADQLCGAERYERSENRLDTRAGSYERKLILPRFNRHLFVKLVSSNEEVFYGKTSKAIYKRI